MRTETTRGQYRSTASRCLRLAPRQGRCRTSVRCRTMASPAPAAFRDRLEAQDVSLFDTVKSQSTRGDRASWLALQGACAARFGEFDYLEIGSHLGGSLQALVRDERVGRIVSIDLRPEQMWDERGKFIRYPGNSTQRMLEKLGELRGADLEKIHTIDADTRTLTSQDIPLRPQLAFVDGEHTYESCLADARFCRSVVASDAAIAFHDAGIIFSAIVHFMAELRADGVTFVAYPLPDSVFVIELGNSHLHATAALRRLLDRRHEHFPPLAHLLARHAARDANLLRRLLLRVWLSELGAGERARQRRIKRIKQRVRKVRKHYKASVRRYRKHAARTYRKRLLRALRRTRRRIAVRLRRQLGEH